MKIADRITRLGTETAFAVSAEAAAFAAQGNKVYPFHLGDMNILTPANVMEATVKAMKDGKTGYCPNAGIPQLREILAADVSASRGIDYTMENVAIQPGGKPTIGKFFLTLMNPGDEVLYPNPGYPIYESQIEFHGGKAVPYGYIEGPDNFDIDTDMLAKQITPRTKLLVLNDLQNPTGAECSDKELEKIAELVLKHDLYVLCDEAYFDIRYGGQSQSLVSLPGMQERCVILHTFSKKFANLLHFFPNPFEKNPLKIISKTNSKHPANHQHSMLLRYPGEPCGSYPCLKSMQLTRALDLQGQLAP